jgi:hypothetical protein
MGESSALQSILYDRGSLRLLDQVPLRDLMYVPCEVETSSSVPDWVLGFVVVMCCRGSCLSRRSTSTSRAPPMDGELSFLLAT